MFISLVGMSGSGKSRWSKKLREELGFKLFSCDDIIEECLLKEVKGLMQHGISAVAEWMGTPMDAQYEDRRRVYLSFEREAVRRSLDAVDKVAKEGALAGLQDIVIDTTGSVIYLDDEILEELKKKTKIVYLETPSQSHTQLSDRYFKHPKPIIWDESFKPIAGENKRETLIRCIKELIQRRHERYLQLAEVVLDFDSHNTNYISTREFMERICGTVTE